MIEPEFWSELTIAKSEGGPASVMQKNFGGPAMSMAEKEGKTRTDWSRAEIRLAAPGLYVLDHPRMASPLTVSVLQNTAHSIVLRL